MIADRPGSVSAFEQGNTAYGRSLEGSLCQERAEGGSVGLVEQLGLGEQLAAAGHRGSPAQEGSPDFRPGARVPRAVRPTVEGVRHVRDSAWGFCAGNAGDEGDIARTGDGADDARLLTVADTELGRRGAVATYYQRSCSTFGRKAGVQATDEGGGVFAEDAAAADHADLTTNSEVLRRHM